MTWVFSHLVFVSSKDRRKKKAFQFSTKFSANSVFTRIADNGAYLLVFENVGHFLGSMRRWQNWRHGQPLLARTTPVQTRTQVSVISDDNGEGCTHSVPLYLSLSLFFVCMNLMISVTMAQTIVWGLHKNSRLWYNLGGWGSEGSPCNGGGWISCLFCGKGSWNTLNFI